MTVPAVWFATHRLPSYSARSLGSFPTANVCETVSVAGSMLDTVRLTGSSTHTCPPAAMMRLGREPTGIAARTARRFSSTRTTTPAPASLTHSDPNPAAKPVGAAPNRTVAASAPWPGEISARALALTGPRGAELPKSGAIANTRSARLPP